MKKSFVYVLVLLLCLLLVITGCASNNVDGNSNQAGKEEKITLRLGHEMPEDHPYHLGSVKFGELLAEKTNGKFEVVYYPNGQLGNQKQLAEMVAANQLDLCLIWQGILENFDPNTGVLSLPFLFNDWQHVYKVVDGEIGDEMFKGVEENGIKVLTNFNNGLYNIVSRMPIEKPEDIKGKKLRVQSSAVFTDYGEVLGAVVTPMAFGEIYTALQLGAIDAQVQGPINVVKSKHFEVAKYTCENHINYLLEPLLMNYEKFDELSTEDQKAFLNAAHEAAVWQRDNAEKAHLEDTEYLEQNGMNYIKADRDAWREAVAPVYEKYSQWDDIVKKIQSVQ